MVAVRSVPPWSTKSSTPVTVTVCAVLQLAVVKVRAPDTVAALSALLEGVIVTSPVGWVLSLTV